MDYKEHAKTLLHEWALCNTAKPKNNVIVDIQIEKDVCSRWAVNLIHNLNWGSEQQLAEACHQLESRLKPLKEKIVIEVLQNGSV
jgi:hypothetical protein